MVDHTIRVSEALAVEKASKDWTPHQRFLVALLKQRMIVTVAEARISETPVDHLVEWLKGCGASMTGRVEPRARSTDLIITSVCLGDDDTDPTDGLDVLAYDGGRNRAAFKLHGRGRAWSLTQTKGAPFFTPDPDEIINSIPVDTGVGTDELVGPGLDAALRECKRVEIDNRRCFGMGIIGADIFSSAAKIIVDKRQTAGAADKFSFGISDERVNGTADYSSSAEFAAIIFHEVELKPPSGSAIAGVAFGTRLLACLPVCEGNGGEMPAEPTRAALSSVRVNEPTNRFIPSTCGFAIESAVECEHSALSTITASQASDRNFSGIWLCDPVSYSTIVLLSNRASNSICPECSFVKSKI